MVKNVQVKSGEEYKILKRTPMPKKVAKIFSVLWILGVVAPAMYFVYNNANAVRNYAVVTGVYEANKALLNQYDDLSAQLMKKIDVNKYTAKIKIPEIKLDKVSGATEKVGKTAGVLSAFGVKGANKVADKSNALQAQVDKVNAEIKTKTQEVAKTLSSDLNKAIKSELDGLGKSQMQKQLQLSDTNYANLVSGRYGVVSESGRKVASAIYAELSKNSHHIVRNVMSAITKYYMYIVWGVMALMLVIGFVPVVIAFKIASALSDNFIKCPHCGKIFLSEKAKWGILAKFKFWK